MSKNPPTTWIYRVPYTVHHPHGPRGQGCLVLFIYLVGIAGPASGRLTATEAQAGGKTNSHPFPFPKGPIILLLSLFSKSKNTRGSRGMLLAYGSSCHGIPVKPH